MKNIGLFGGTFDPIHNGHLHIARAFADEIGLDLVVFLPAGDPYHKDSTRTPAQERLNMVELAIADEPKFAASDCDIVRDGATYTFDTVQIFRQQFPGAQLWWLMGSDSLMQLHTWKNGKPSCARPISPSPCAKATTSTKPRANCTYGLAKPCKTAASASSTRRCTTPAPPKSVPISPKRTIQMACRNLSPNTSANTNSMKNSVYSGR